MSIFDDDGGWPNCKSAGCSNKACLALESPYCHPHTLLLMIHSGQNEFFAKAEIERWASVNATP